MKKIIKKGAMMALVFSFVFAFFGINKTIAAGPATVNLLTASNFTILSKAAITNVPTSSITGNVGASPISGSFIGITCTEITGTIYSTDAAGPMPCRITGPSLLTTAVSNMEAAYTDAETRAPGVGASNLNVGAGTLNGENFVPGTYTWTSPVSIAGGITLTGGATDVWIFQISGTLDLEVSQIITLAGGALPENIFWQVAGATTLKTTSHFEGNILAKTNIAMQSGASMDGKLLAQTGITLIANNITSVGGVSPILGTINVIKTVINDNGENKIASDFTINVTGTGVSSSSFVGQGAPGTEITLSAGAYSIDENNYSNYTKTLIADCAGTIAAGENKTCTITNDDIRHNTSSGSIPYSYNNTTIPTQTITPTTTTTITTVTTNIPTLPNTGFPVQTKNIPWDTIMVYGLCIAILISLVIVLRKAKI